MKRIIFFTAIFAFVLANANANGIALESYKTDVTASFYGEDFHGKKTSNGEKFNMNDYTCAHKELPFDSILRITNLANGKTCDVRVNDRGPFVTTREIDLSKAAAVKLDMISSGTAQVKIEIVERGPDTKLSVDTANSAKRLMDQRYGSGWDKSSGGTASAPASKTKASDKKTSSKTTSSASSSKNVAPGKIWDIQVASFSTKDNATNFARQLKKDGFENIVFQSNSEIVRVVLSKVPSSEIGAILEKLEQGGYNDYVVRERTRD